jgi:hypothetical protein
LRVYITARGCETGLNLPFLFQYRKKINQSERSQLEGATMSGKAFGTISEQQAPNARGKPSTSPNRKQSEPTG